MFKSKTILIVGAGASSEIGLPVGSDLKNVVGKKLDIKFPDGYRQEGGDRTIYEAYRARVQAEGGHDPNGYRAAGVKISESLPLASSIDNYLEAHAGNKEIELCGKLAIVLSILEAERKSAFYVDHRQGHQLDLSKSQLQSTWYMAFMRALTEGAAKTDLEALFANLSFIIFNYDRCIETFLHRALQLYYDSDSKTVELLLNKVNFFHPYGVVGTLPWQVGTTAKVDFGGEVSSETLLDLTGGIRTFSERIASGEFLDLMRAEISLADTAVYLGFSYHPQNMELLKVEEMGRVSRVFGTAYGISQSDQNVVLQSIHESLKSHVSEISIELVDLTCAGLFAAFSRSVTQ